MRSDRKPSNRQIFVSFGARLAAPVWQVPNAHLSDAIGVLTPFTAARIVSVERVVFRSAAGYDTKSGLPSRLSVNVPFCGMVRSEYSIRTAATMGLPSGCVAIGNFGESRLDPRATSACQPASTTV